MTTNKISEFIPYNSGDEKKILKLFSDVFGIIRPLENWEWQFKNHPQGESWILLVKAEDEIVGHFAFRRNHINFLGKEVVAGQACDAMIRADWQGKGIFTKLFVEANRYVEQEGLQVVFGFPGRMSYPADMTKLNRQRIANLDFFSFRIGCRNKLGRVLDRIAKVVLQTESAIIGYLEKKLIPHPYVINTTSRLPEDVDEMLRECHSYEVLSLWKDLNYMKWRYEDNPSHSYIYHILYVEDRIEGLAVTRNCGDSIVICEFIHRTKELRQSVALLRSIVRCYIRETAQIIQFIGWDNGFFEFVFSKCGFVKSPSGVVFTAECFNNRKLDRMLSIPQNWTIVQGDMDVI